MTSDDIVVTGIGLMTPAGSGTADTWTGLLAGRPVSAPDPALRGLAVDFSCRAPLHKPASVFGHVRARRMDRAAQLAVLAGREAAGSAGLNAAACDWERVAVVLGVGGNSVDTYVREFGLQAAGRYDRVSPLAILRSLPSTVPAEVAADLGARGPALAVSAACASGASAISVAAALLRGGACDIAVTGGAEAGCCPGLSVCFHQMRALSTRRHDPAGASRPFDRGRDGFVLGEGAGVLVLERHPYAAARGAAVRARLAGCASVHEPGQRQTPHPSGDGAAAALRAALREAGLEARDVDLVSAHATSTVLGDAAEHLALRSVFGSTPPTVTALKSVLGHTLGGAGGISAACAVLALEHQLVPPTANLDAPDPDIDLDVVTKSPRAARLGVAVCNSFGFGGLNSVLVLTQPA
ncbi:beta-ketoacyl-[acyl-carrier-protein] synthase family protein [Streptomyces sp. NPDC127051]|uniref:beta-ketoacyl-[acyl-carrier-protein] synthase family protein n=1 Tax=Streptomyces sp. NPDC127051 TaxID=3347119 RepID=UPI0036602108